MLAVTPSAAPMAVKSKHTKSQTINVRVYQYQCDLIDKAASLLGRNRSDFILEAACQRAEDVMLDKTFFVCDSDQWQRFCDALDAPPQKNEKLAKMLSKASPWES
jgi:uncharacterized protein (DUF1778 family)